MLKVLLLEILDKKWVRKGSLALELDFVIRISIWLRRERGVLEFGNRIWLDLHAGRGRAFSLRFVKGVVRYFLEWRTFILNLGLVLCWMSILLLGIKLIQTLRTTCQIIKLTIDVLLRAIFNYWVLFRRFIIVMIVLIFFYQLLLLLL